MAYRGLGLTLTTQGSGETDFEESGWLHGDEVIDDSSSIIPFGSSAGAMTGPTPTAAQIAAGMPGAGLTLSQWLQANKNTVYLGAGALLLMAMFGGRRR